MDILNIAIFTAAFAFIALASNQIGQLFSKINLPLISGFLFAGVIAGPYVLGLISEEATANLRFIDEISLAVIAFAAGSELYIQELKPRLKSIISVALGNTLVIPILGGLTLFFLSSFIPFMGNMPVGFRLGVALLGGTILVARSPSSAIAVVNELRARGPFTQTILGVTMILDVVVIFLFAFSSSLADILIASSGFDPGLLILLLVELPISLAEGYGLGKLIQFILTQRINEWVKIGLVLLLGYGVFVLSEMLRYTTHHNAPVEIFLEPLLICMVGSFVVTNYTPHRNEFIKILHQISPSIYIIFFTLTGAALQLDILGQVWPIALALFGIRLVGIFAGSFGGGIFAGDPMRHNRLSWMAYITQAGIGLGLAKEVAVEFPEWGSLFATLMIAVIVINQIAGPPFLKWVINLVGEAHTRAKTPEFDGVRDAVIFGLEGQSLALARQLFQHGWNVKIATRKVDYMEEQVAQTDFEVQNISNLSLEELHQLEIGKAEAVITLLSDEESYQVCELVYEHFGTENLVVRLNDRANFDRFHQLGALIVEPSTAIVSLLDHLVRSPTAASLVLGMEAGQDIVDVEVCNPALHGVALRNLRLPLDTLILSIHREGRLLISHGYTRLKIGDRVTVVGSEKSLEEIMRRLAPC